jgi:hypothetical protein
LATKKRTHADALIERAKRGQHAADPSPTALAELKKVLEHNDHAAWGKRVSADTVLELLASLGWDHSRQALDALCRRRFGRRTFGTP